MHISIVLFPGFRLLDCLLSQEVFRQANHAAGRELITMSLRTITAEPVVSQDGVAISPDTMGWSGAQATDLILLIADQDPLLHLPMGLRAYLKTASGATATLGGFCGGVTVLSEMHYLDGFAVVNSPQAQTMPKSDLDDEPKAEPNHDDRAYILDRQRLTAVSGMAGVAGLLSWIAHHSSVTLAEDVAKRMGYPMPDVLPEAECLGETSDPVLRRMQTVMSAHLVDPLPLDTVAQELELSPKQMRTRCQNGLGITPMQAYLSLRLNRARALVQDTELSVQEIAVATGFVSPSAFTRSYRAQFGETPRAIRAARRAG